MISLDDWRPTEDEDALILAMDHGLEYGPAMFETVPETLATESGFETAIHDAHTGLTVSRSVLHCVDSGRTPEASEAMSYDRATADPTLSK